MGGECTQQMYSNIRYTLPEEVLNPVRLSNHIIHAKFYSIVVFSL